MVNRFAAGTAPASPDELADLANRGQLRDALAHLEDPVEDLICAEVLAPGGGYLVGAGMSGCSYFWLRLLIRALFGSPWPQDSGVPDRLMRPVMTALTISDLALRAAGLTRLSQAGGAIRQDVVVPADVGELQEAVSFDLNAPSHSELVDVVEPFVSEQVRLGRRGDHAPAATPFAVEDGELILALPFEIASAIRHLVATTALATDGAHTLSNRYLLAAHLEAAEAATLMGWTPLDRADALLTKPSSNLPMAESVFRFDDDKLAHVLTLGDDLEGYDRGSMFQTWKLGRSAGAVVERVGDVQAHLLGRPDTTEVFTLLLFAPLDRGVTFRLPAASDLPMLPLPLHDLAILARADPDPLAIWKFDRARRALDRRAEVHSPSILDTYATYRELGHSLESLAASEAVILMPGGGAQLRQDVQIRADIHPVPHPVGVGVEVERWLAHAPTVPIFVPRTPLDGKTCMVETGELRIWIEVIPAEVATGFDFTIAYWLWQVGSDVEGALHDLADRNGVVELLVELASPELWAGGIHPLTSQKPATKVGRPAFEARRDDEGALKLRVNDSAWVALQAHDNAGERELLTALLELLALEEAAATPLLDRHAPIGFKKHLFVVQGPDPRLSDESLPPYRPVRAHDRHEISTLVSSQVVRKRNLPPGEVAAAKRGPVLHAYVAEAFDELEQRVALLAPEGLLERLLAAGERATHEQAYRQASALTRTLTYGNADESLANRDRDLQEQIQFAISARFLVEYIAAKPPRGNLCTSSAVTDTLMALASEIVEAGWVSDADQYELAPARVHVSPTGRLIFGSGSLYENSTALFVKRRAANEVDSGGRVLESLVWRPPERPISLPDHLDEAFAAETGISFTETGQLFNHAIDHALSHNVSLVVTPRDELISALASKLAWPLAKVAAALEALTLGPRPQFLEPGAPYKRSDVYPWRFNRSLSLMRRPFVERDDEILYGVRHLYEAQQHVAELLESGRYPARSRELKRFLGRWGKQVGRAFEDAVAALFDHASMITVVRRKRFGNQCLQREDGSSLGDIDVLAIDQVDNKVFVVDAKCQTPAMTPSELALELGQLSRNRHSAIRRVQERTEWVEQHLEHVLAAAGLNHERAWTVEPMIVLDRDLLSAYLSDPPVRVLTYRTLELELGLAKAAVAHE